MIVNNNYDKKINNVSNSKQNIHLYNSLHLIPFLITAMLSVWDSSHFQFKQKFT